jgi:alkylation response protein AidB-like acyl-CoA dehydrogenase
MSTSGIDSKLVFDVARQVAEKELRPLLEEYGDIEALTRGALTRLAEAGFLGGVFPEAVGGAGLDYQSYARLCEAIGGTSPSLFTSALTVQLSLVAGSIFEFGNDEQKRSLLPDLLSGKRLGAFALSEPDVGSDPAACKTTATEKGDAWLLNGTKYWISNGSIADLILVFAQTEPGSRHRGIGAFLVDGKAAGLTRHPVPDKFGLHQSDTAALYFDGVEVGPDRVLGAPGQGLTIAQAALEKGRLSTAACAVGIAQACLDSVVTYAKDRVQWGKPIAAHQLVQEGVAQMATSITAARLLTLKAAEDMDEGRPARESV